MTNENNPFGALRAAANSAFGYATGKFGVHPSANEFNRLTSAALALQQANAAFEAFAEGRTHSASAQGTAALARLAISDALKAYPEGADYVIKLSAELKE